MFSIWSVGRLFGLIACLLACDIETNQCDHDTDTPAMSARHLLQSRNTASESGGNVQAELVERHPIASTESKSSGTDAVLVFWPHGYMGPQKALDLSEQCGFPCKQASSDDGGAYDQADAFMTFPIDENPPQNNRGAASIAFSMESMDLYGRFSDRYDAVSNLNWRSTVPWVLLDPNGLNRGIDSAWTHRPGWDERKPAAVFVAKNCGMERGRNEFLAKLVEYGVPVEAISDCKPAGMTGEWPADVPREDKGSAIAKYRVYLALENVPEQGYVTEKLSDGLQAGCVVVYLGAPDIDNYVPESSIINANGFELSTRMAEISEKIKTAIADSNTWNGYKEWPHQSPTEWNGGKVYQSFSWSFLNPGLHTICRVCRFAFAKRMGLMWDHQTQNIAGNITIPPSGDVFWKHWREDTSPSLQNTPPSLLAPAP